MRLICLTLLSAFHLIPNPRTAADDCLCVPIIFESPMTGAWTVVPLEEEDGTCPWNGTSCQPQSVGCLVSFIATWTPPTPPPCTNPRTTWTNTSNWTGGTVDGTKVSLDDKIDCGQLLQVEVRCGNAIVASLTVACFPCGA
jgi:hypothetical protein